MRWAWRRQMELARRIVGQRGDDSTGSGRCSSRVGRAPFIAASACPGAGRRGWRGDRRRRLHALGDVAVARQQAHDVLRAQPQRQPVGEIDRAVLAQRMAAIAPVSGSASCVPVHASTSGADRIISSTPKPGSSSPSFSSNSFISLGLSRLGRLVPIAVRSTEPSTR